MVVDSLGTVLTTTTTTSPLPTYDYIAPSVASSTMAVSTFSGVLSYVALAVLLVLLFKGAYALLFVS